MFDAGEEEVGTVAPRPLPGVQTRSAHPRTLAFPRSMSFPSPRWDSCVTRVHGADYNKVVYRHTSACADQIPVNEFAAAEADCVNVG